MAYYYQNPYLQQMPQLQMPQQQNNGLIWVQGESGAKSYLVAPNTTVMLMDSENQRFYLKSSDQSGMPHMRSFEYSEISQSAPKTAPADRTMDLSSYATKAEFDAFKDEINGILKNIPRQVTKNGKSSVSGTESEG